MKCPYCETNITEDMKYCPICGQNLSELNATSNNSGNVPEQNNTFINYEYHPTYQQYTSDDFHALSPNIINIGIILNIIILITQIASRLFGLHRLFAPFHNNFIIYNISTLITLITPIVFILCLLKLTKSDIKLTIIPLCMIFGSSIFSFIRYIYMMNFNTSIPYIIIQREVMPLVILLLMILFYLLYVNSNNSSMKICFSIFTIIFIYNRISTNIPMIRMMMQDQSNNLLFINFIPIIMQIPANRYTDSERVGT